MCEYTSSEPMSAWQGARAGIVLGEVARVLAAAGEARALALAGAVCRSWRRAIAAASWRPLLCALRPASLSDTQYAHCRELFVQAAAPWRSAWREPPPTPVALTHAALHPALPLLAAAAADATIMVWVREEQERWSVRAQCCMRAHGWSSAVRVEWAPRGASGMLLAAGALALSARWELAVLCCEPSGDARVSSLRLLSRAGCAPGAAGCWAAAGAFLSLQLRLLAPGHAVTTVWLNSATQETESENTGVVNPILQIYNEASTHITHVSVVRVPGLDSGRDGPDSGRDGPDSGHDGPDAYCRATRWPSASHHAQSEDAEDVGAWLVSACGAPGGPKGVASALAAWDLGARARAPIDVSARAGPSLRERATAARARLAALEPLAEPSDDLHGGPPLEPPVEPPDEHAVRALCSPPTETCPLQARVIGLVVHPNERCVWVSTTSIVGELALQMVCVSLPTLHVLRRLVTPPTAAVPPPPLRAHYVQPALSPEYVGSPDGSASGRVLLWCAVSGARVVSALRHEAPARALLLPPLSPPPRAAPLALVLTTDALHAWRCTATAQPRGWGAGADAEEDAGGDCDT